MSFRYETKHLAVLARLSLGNNNHNYEAGEARTHLLAQN
jgi:hypothetical protein